MSKLAEHIAGLERIELTPRHRDVIDYLLDEYFNNNQSTPNTRAILKAMSERWGERHAYIALAEISETHESAASPRSWRHRATWSRKL